jgi:hypothetical protein
MPDDRARSPSMPGPTDAGPEGRPAQSPPVDRAEWQVRFDHGHQQRYLPDRSAVLRYVLSVGPHAASPRFEVYAESDPVRLADGTDGGRQFTLVEVVDLSRPGEAERLWEELGHGA